MHHKRGRPKSRRAGCLLCKPHKRNGAKRSANGLVRTARQARVAELREREGRDDT